MHTSSPKSAKCFPLRRRENIRTQMSIWLRSVQMFSLRFTWKRKQEQPIWFSLKTYGKHLHTNVDLVKKCANVFLAFFLWNSYRNARERCENMKLIALRKYDIWSLTICDPFHSKPVRCWLVICNCQSFSWISLNVCALSLCVCAWFSDMVRVAQLKQGAKLKTRQRKLETWKQLAASAPASDIAKTIVERATAWATAASQAEDAAMAL